MLSQAQSKIVAAQRVCSGWLVEAGIKMFIAGQKLGDIFRVNRVRCAEP